MNSVVYVTIFLVLNLTVWTTNGRSLNQQPRRVKRSTSGESGSQQLTFKACRSNDTFCSGHGECYESVDQTTKKICRCDDEYYGPQCENKADKLMETLVLAVAIFAGVMLIIVIVISIELCRRRRYYEKMKRQLLESRPAEKPADMYTERKPSYASSIDEKYDLTPVNGYVKRNSFTPMDDANQHLKPETTTSPTHASPKQTKLDKAFIKENQTALDNEDGVDMTKNDPEDSSVKSDSILDDDKSHDGDNDQERRGRSPTFNNDAVSVTSEAMSLPESERNLIPSPSNQQPRQPRGRPLSENEAYELYLAQRKAQMMLPNNAYMAPPQPHHNPTQLPQCRKVSSPNIMPSQHQQRSPLANTPSPNSYNNQVFFNTMQPRSHNNAVGANLHPQQAGRRKISTQSNQTARFGALPVSPSRQYEAAKQRQRSPNRANNRGLGQQNNYTDGKGRPLSMTDLRVLEDISRNPGYDRRRARSVEDILALEDRAPSEVSVGSANNGGRRKKPGMWAQSQGR